MSTPLPNQPRNLFPNTPNDHNEDPTNPPPSDIIVEPSPITVLNHRQNASSSTPNSQVLGSPSSTYQLDHLIDVALASQSPMASESKYEVIASELEKNLLNAYMHEVWTDHDATTRMNDINDTRLGSMRKLNLVRINIWWWRFRMWSSWRCIDYFVWREWDRTGERACNCREVKENKPDQGEVEYVSISKHIQSWRRWDAEEELRRLLRIVEYQDYNLLRRNHWLNHW